MRRVAKELDVAVSALYWHVKDKQSLLGAMVDRLLADVNFTPPTGDTAMTLQFERNDSTTPFLRLATLRACRIRSGPGNRRGKNARFPQRRLTECTDYRCDHGVDYRPRHS